MKVKVLALIFVLSIARSQTKFAFVPFDDMSRFRGKWVLKLEIPRYLGDFLMKFYGVEVIPVDSVLKFYDEGKFNAIDAILFSELNKQFGVRYVIDGKILVFDVSRFATGFPEMAGYESYNAEVEVEVEVYDALSGDRIVIFGISGQVKEQGLGLTLLGKPTEKFTQFYYIPEAFGETVEGLGETKGVTELEVVEIKGKVLHIGRQNLVYINLGSGDGIVSGVRAYVYDSDKKVADVEVVDVIDSHLSACKVLNSLGEIRKDLEVKVKIVK
jgi:hypothetical protein